MEKTIKQDDAIFKALNLLTIERIICQTDKGTLTLKIRKGDSKYHLCLDSVPLEVPLNKELMELLFPIPKMEVPQVNRKMYPEFKASNLPLEKSPIVLPKKKGRPAKTK